MAAHEEQRPFGAVRGIVAAGDGVGAHDGFRADGFDKREIGCAEVVRLVGAGTIHEGCERRGIVGDEDGAGAPALKLGTHVGLGDGDLCLRGHDGQRGREKQ